MPPMGVISLWGWGVLLPPPAPLQSSDRCGRPAVQPTHTAWGGGNELEWRRPSAAEVTPQPPPYRPPPQKKPADLHGLLVVVAEELVVLVALHRFTAVLPHVEHCQWEGLVRGHPKAPLSPPHPPPPRPPPQLLTPCRHADPVEVAGELAGDVGLATGWQPHQDHHGGAVGELGYSCFWGGGGDGI